MEAVSQDINNLNLAITPTKHVYRLTLTACLLLPFCHPVSKATCQTLFNMVRTTVARENEVFVETSKLTAESFAQSFLSFLVSLLPVLFVDLLSDSHLFSLSLSFDILTFLNLLEHPCILLRVTFTRDYPVVVVSHLTVVDYGEVVQDYCFQLGVGFAPCECVFQLNLHISVRHLLT